VPPLNLSIPWTTNKAHHGDHGTTLTQRNPSRNDIRRRPTTPNVATASQRKHHAAAHYHQPSFFVRANGGPEPKSSQQPRRSAGFLIGRQVGCWKWPIGVQPSRGD
jgi:hypothetical protein